MTEAGTVASTVGNAVRADDPAALVAAARCLAAAFSAGRRLVISAPDHADHAHHMAVEFLHPVIAGTVALPAVVGEPAGESPGAGDVVLAIGATCPDNAELWIPATGEAGIMTAYHLLWELVQLELSSTGGAAGGGDTTAFLYPFLDGETGGADDHLRASALAKATESRQVAVAAVDANAVAIGEVADVIAAAAVNGRRVLTIGNGGSACDAARAVRLLTVGGVPAQSLAADYAVVTALANDLGADRVFARQLEALGRPGDVLIGFSTSGTSSNLLAAFDRAREIGLTTVGFAGYDGAAFVVHDTVDHALAVASQSVHRIQEAQAALLDAVVAHIDVTAVGGER